MTYRAATEHPTLQRPPPKPITWHAHAHIDAAKHSCTVEAQTWYDARQKAAAILGVPVERVQCSPGVCDAAAPAGG